MSIPAMRRSRMATIARTAVAAVLFAGLAACQSVDTQGALDPGAMRPGPSAPVDAETLGRGGVTVTLLVPRTSAGSAARDAAEYRDGAALAMTDLGADHITLNVLDTRGQAAQAATRTREQAEKGARLIIGPASSAELKAVVDARRRNQPPVLALVDNDASRPVGVFALRSDETDSVSAAVSQARGMGKRNVLAVVSPDVSARSVARLKRRVEAAGGTFLGSITYRSPQDAAGATVARADAVVLYAGAAPAEAAAALRAAGLPSDAVLIGTSAWTQQHHVNPVLAGALVPVPDQSGLKEVNARMQAAYGRPMTIEAAHAYDAVALAAGIVRTLGAEGLVAGTLSQPTGFRGATGAFRFGSDGSVTRLYSIFRAGPGGLRLVAAAAPGF